MPSQTGTLLIVSDIGTAWGRDQSQELARHLEDRLNQPVILCSTDRPDLSVLAGLKSLVDSGLRRAVLLPLGLLPLQDSESVVQAVMSSKQAWPFLDIHFAAPLTWLEWSGWLRVTTLDCLQTQSLSPADTAVVLVSRSDSNPLTNANLARLAHLLREIGAFPNVTYAFLGDAPPGIDEALNAVAHTAANNVIIVPWLFTFADFLPYFEHEVQPAVQAREHCETLATPALTHPSLVNILVSNQFSGLAEEAFSITNSIAGVLSGAGGKNSSNAVSAGITPDEALGLKQLERKISARLPPEYQGKYEAVSPQSMGTASLKFDSDGKVAWDEIWTSFCDLALAGGPPHRGTLLEAVAADEALADPERYQAVVAEIERAIQLVTSLPVVTSRVPGWVGIRCESEEMAVWLLRAIIVENVMVRREGKILYLPAGPQFRIEREIKNVVTCVAKTIHYWTAHLAARRQSHEEYFS